MHAKSCPRCKSKNLWYDIHGWGCNNCGYAVIGGQPTSALIKDKEVNEFDERMSQQRQAELYRESRCAF